jgi:hypothetical protein
VGLCMNLMRPYLDSATLALVFVIRRGVEG